MPQVTMPDGTLVNMPDVLTPEQARALRAIASPRGPQAPAARVARSPVVPASAWQSTPAGQAAQGQIDAANAVGTLVSGAAAGIPAAVASLLARVTGQEHEAAKSGVQDALTYEGTPNSRSQLAAAGDAVGTVTRPLGRAVDKANLALMNSGTAGEITSDILRNTLGTAGDVLQAYPAAGAGAGLARATSNGVRRVAGTLDRVAGSQATKIAREAAGDNRGAIEATLTSADPSLNAGQAAAGVNQPTWQALQEVAARQAKDPFYHEQGLTQASGRAKALEGVTPDLEAATATRAKASGPLYEQAKNTYVQVTPELAGTLERIEPSVLREAERLSRESGNPFSFGDIAKKGVPKYIPGDVLHYVKLAMDQAAKPGSGVLNGIQSVAPAITGQLRTEFTEALSNANPIYGVARETHAALSPPVNQSQVLNEVSSTLRNSSGGSERVGPLLTQLDKSPERVLKRATGQSRATDLGDVLTDKQMSVIRDVTGQLLRDENISAQAKAGAGGLSRIMNENTSKWRIPALFSPKVTVMNKGLSVAEASISRRVVDRLVEGMKNGESAKALLAGMSPMEKSKLLEFLSVTPKNLAASAASTAASEQN